MPARLVGGYNGGALGPSGSVAVVRQANAHTWVEAWLGESRGWVTFDPTPAEGIPALEGQSGLQRLVWAWQRLQDSWDRYVLTFGLSEQISLLGAIGDLIDWLKPRLRAQHAGWAVLLVLISVGLPLLILRQRRKRATRAAPRPASAVAIGKLARRLVNAGIPVPPGATVRTIGETARERWPGAARPVDELVWLAERELYAAGWSSSGNGAAARRLWAKIGKT